jgi:type IV pilus assembly protein PilB
MVKLSQENDKLLAEFLLNNNAIQKDHYEQAASFDKNIGCGITNALIDLGFTNDDIIANAFAKAYGLKRSETKLSDLRKRTLKEVFSEVFIVNKRVVPVDATDSKVFVAVSEPSALESFNNLQVMSGRQLVEATVVTLADMEEYLEQLKKTDDYIQNVKRADEGNPDGSSTANSLSGKQDASGQNIADYALQDDKNAAKRSIKIVAGKDVIEFVNNVINNAITLGVSDIHIEPFREDAQVRYRKDGVLQMLEEYTEFLTLNYSAVVTRLKILANLDISERRLPQDGAIVSSQADKDVDIRLSVLPTVNGERVVMRILDPDSANYTLEQLGLPELGLQKFRKAIHSPQGLILVTGPTGSGKSTTLYAALKEINKDDINILTAEDPVEYDLKGIGQVQVKENIGLTFSSALRSFLRQDPEVIMVGEIRDKETSDIAIKASQTGHLVLSTLHTNDAPSTIIRLLNMGIPGYLLASSLMLVLAQRLARVNCKHCLEEDVNVSTRQLIDLGFHEDEAESVKPMHGKGCDRCLDTGVSGRIGIHEILAVNKPVKQAIIRGASEHEIVEIAKKDGFQTMQEIGLNLLKTGKISITEFQRVLVIE